MRRTFSIPLMRQATLSLVIAVAAVLFGLLDRFVLRLPSPLHVTLALTLWAVFTIVPYAAAIWISYDVRTGVESGRWPEAEIERFRLFYGTPWLKGLSITLAFAALFFFVFDRASHHVLRDLGYESLLLSQTLQQLLLAARRPRSRPIGQRLDFSNTPPIQSSHWGQPRS